MSSRSEQYLVNAEKCQQYADAADTAGTKSLYGVLASQWRHLAEEADRTDQIGSPRGSSTALASPNNGPSAVEQVPFSDSRADALDAAHVITRRIPITQAIALHFTFDRAGRLSKILSLARG
jgi:hypothetical protein